MVYCVKNNIHDAIVDEMNKDERKKTNQVMKTEALVRK